MNIPDELKYTKDHEWVRVEGDVAIIGITDFAQRELGDIVFIEIDQLDEEVAAGDTFGTIEAVKTVSDLFSPISGTVTEFNEGIEDAPESINGDPYNDGWIVKMSIKDASEIDGLLTADQYKELIAE